MSECPRILTKAEMIEGLQSGRALIVDRRDAPELAELLEMRDHLGADRGRSVFLPQVSLGADVKPTPPERDRRAPVTLEAVVGLRKAAAARDLPVRVLINNLLDAIATDQLVDAATGFR
jgi:hypothetical protein